MTNKELEKYEKLANNIYDKDYFNKYKVEIEEPLFKGKKNEKYNIKLKKEVLLFTNEIVEKILMENNRKFFILINETFLYQKKNSKDIDDNGYELISKYYKLPKSNKGGETLSFFQETKYYKEIKKNYIYNHIHEGINLLTREDVEMLLTESDSYDRKCFLYNLDMYNNNIFKLLNK